MNTLIIDSFILFWGGTHVKTHWNLNLGHKDGNGSPVEEKSVWMLYHSHHTYTASLQNEILNNIQNNFIEELVVNSK